MPPRRNIFEKLTFRGSGEPKKWWKNIFFNFFFQSCLESCETSFGIKISHFEKIIFSMSWLISLPCSNLKRFDQTERELYHFEVITFIYSSSRLYGAKKLIFFNTPNYDAFTCKKTWKNREKNFWTFLGHCRPFSYRKWHFWLFLYHKNCFCQRYCS